MKVLFAASEVAPIIKLGGLGDVAGSLPKALEKIGVDVDVIVPFFPSAKVHNLDFYKSEDISVPFAGKTNIIEVFKAKLPDSSVDVLLLRNSEYFSGGGISAFANNVSETDMFSFFDRSVVEYIKSGFNTYNLIHCNDWHTGMITNLLDEEIGESRPATIMTIHNLSYQGIGDNEATKDLGLVPGSDISIDWNLETGPLNFLLQGITTSDYISTVSPSYANEILYADVGGQLSEILLERKNRLIGILNGIDYAQFPKSYVVDSWKLRKGELKSSLQKELGLRQGSRKPLFAFVSRLDPNQKGLDILYEIIPEILKKGGQFVLLGTGDKVWEQKFVDLKNAFGRGSDMSINIKFDTELANRIYAGSDFLLIPSKFEPCGLTQMIAMWYGTVPVVHAVGGLRDSVKDGENGFVFNIYSASEFLKSVANSINIYSSSKYDDMVIRAMQTNFSWDESARKYKKLYEEVIEIRASARKMNIKFGE